MSGMLAVTELCERLDVVGRLDAVTGPIKQRRRGHTAGEVPVGIAAAQLAREGCWVGLDRRRTDIARAAAGSRAGSGGDDRSGACPPVVRRAVGGGGDRPGRHRHRGLGPAQARGRGPAAPAPRSRLSRRDERDRPRRRQLPDVGGASRSRLRPHPTPLSDQQKGTKGGDLLTARPRTARATNGAQGRRTWPGGVEERSLQAVLASRHPGRASRSLRRGLR